MPWVKITDENPKIPRGKKQKYSNQTGHDEFCSLSHSPSSPPKSKSPLFDRSSDSRRWRWSINTCYRNSNNGYNSTSTIKTANGDDVVFHVRYRLSTIAANPSPHRSGTIPRPCGLIYLTTYTVYGNVRAATYPGESRVLSNGPAS